MNLKTIIIGDSRLSEIIRFGIVGCFATLLQYGIYVLFLFIFSAGEGLQSVSGLYTFISQTASYFLSFIANFILSNYFTFHTKPNTRKGIGFALSHLINYALQALLTVAFETIIGPTLALLPAMAICIPINYLLVRFALTGKHSQSRSKL